jgi:predicted phage terminase large subunit-like protein
VELHELLEKVNDTAKRFPLDMLIVENKAAGHSVAQEMRRLYSYSKFGVQLVDTGANDKVARLYSVQHLFEEGLVFAPDRSWADMVIQQCASFPKGKHDDLVDTVSQALKFFRTTGMLQRTQEVQEDLNSMMHHHGAPPPPLYPI